MNDMVVYPTLEELLPTLGARERFKETAAGLGYTKVQPTTFFAVQRCWRDHLSTLFEEQSPAPGTPECEKFSDIAKALKEIEAERQRSAQAATLPEEK